MTCTPPDDASLTVLLIDDAETQGVRIQEVLRPYGVWVEWRSSYRAATRVLHDPDMGQLIDLILIDQDFTNDEVPDAELLTHAELGAVAGTEEWDVRLHQGLFVMTRLSEDMREGLISFTPMMILTHYARVEVAARVILGGYESKRRLLSDPYTALKGHLEQLRPARADVETRIATLQAELGLDDELARDVTRSVVRGLDLEETCDALRRLPGPGDWRAVGRTLERLGEERRAFSMERLWASLGAAWLTSPQGWLRVCHVEAVASLGHDFEVFRVEICRSGTTFSALLAARALPPGSVPGVARLRESFRLVRAVDARNRPVRLRAGSWTIVGCWVPEPERPGSDARAAARRLAGATRHIRELHSKGLAHGSLTVTSAGFESEPVFGGVRCLAGGEDLSALCRDDLAQLPALAAAAFGEDPPETTRQVLACWSAAVRAGDLEHAESILESAEVDGRPPAYFECDRRLYSGGEVGFRDLLLASLGPNDAVLREVRCGGLSASPLDFVVCAGGALAVLEHRTRLRRVVLRDDEVVRVEADSAEDERCRRSVARCRRMADILAARVEAALGIRPDSIRRLSAVVVADGTAVEPPGSASWRPVVTEAEVILELTRLSRAEGSPRGVDMARYVHRPAARSPETRLPRRRAIYWTKVPVGQGLTRMRTWRKQWPPEAWHPLLTSLLAARDALSVVEVGSRPFPLGLLRAYDDEGQQRDIALDSAVIDSVEYDLHAPGVASPLSEYFGDAGSEPSRRRMAVAVLRNLMSWERSGLAYRAMRPDGLVHADGRVYCDLLRWVATLDRESRWRMRCGAAACLVFLLSPWPYAWPAVLGGTMPALHERADERSAWGIAESAVTMLLDEHIDPVRVEVALTDKADLLDAAALLDHRFPAWPAGLAREVFA